ncbi:MAG: hypothetical protein KKA73_24305 [Chloroflexi bacterium]|nr:hypothetical protein [Chloroflexota bacterium]MBU1750816.1 hypothetical protein [Chloroflexota bacterium]
MYSFRHWLSKPNLWIVLALLMANGVAWFFALTPQEVRVVEPRLAPDLVALRQRLGEGANPGETFTVVVTNQEVEESIAWYLAGRPNIPFANPRVEIHPGWAEAWGEARVAGLRISLHGRARASLQDGKPVIIVEELGMAGLAVPDPIRQRIQQELDAQLDFSGQDWPVIITRFELQEGQAVIEGTFR